MVGGMRKFSKLVLLIVLAWPATAIEDTGTCEVASAAEKPDALMQVNAGRATAKGQLGLQPMNVGKSPVDSCKSACGTAGYCCGRVSGCQRPSCSIGCEYATFASNLAECNSMCQRTEGCTAFPPDFEGCAISASTCSDCQATCGAGVMCEPDGGCEHACSVYFAQPPSLLAKDGDALTLCPQFGEEAEMDHWTSDIFAYWWYRNFDRRSVAESMHAVVNETRTDGLANGMNDPPNAAKGYYFNVYIHHGAEDDFPHGWGAGVGTNSWGLPFFTMGSAIDVQTWRHEAYHIMEYNRNAMPYHGESKWFIEAAASWYALIKDSSAAESFINNYCLANNPHAALWQSASNGLPDELGIWDYGNHQYAVQTMMWYLTDFISPAVMDRSVIHGSFNSGTTLTPQEYMFNEVGGDAFRQGFIEWAAHTANDHDYLTEDQKAVSKNNQAMSGYNYTAWAQGAPINHQYAAVQDTFQGSGTYDLTPDAKLKPRGWAYNVILLNNTAPGTYQFQFVGDASGSEGATSIFAARALAGLGTSAVFTPFTFAPDRLSGSAEVTGQVSGGQIRLVVAATPEHFTGMQNYGYTITVTFTSAPAPPAPTPAPTPAPAPAVIPAPAPASSTGSIPLCRAKCTNDGFCCGLVSGCQRASCAVGCYFAAEATTLQECKARCEENNKCGWYQITGFHNLHWGGWATSCSSCKDGGDEGGHCTEQNAESNGNCEKAGGCESACDTYFR